jgi:hypothetical protein
MLGQDFFEDTKAVVREALSRQRKCVTTQP